MCPWGGYDPGSIPGSPTLVRRSLGEGDRLPAESFKQKTPSMVFFVSWHPKKRGSCARRLPN